MSSATVPKQERGKQKHFQRQQRSSSCFLSFPPSAPLEMQGALTAKTHLRRLVHRQLAAKIMESFDYRTVPVPCGHTRLLRLPEAQHADSAASRLLNCYLKSVPLARPPEFTALSYVWGKSSQKTSIIINGRSLSITNTLAVALKSIKLCTAERLLWVDQICINQQDEAEKAIQVPLMGNIYSTATTTIAWLGEASQRSDEAMNYIASTGSAAIDVGIRDFKQLDTILATQEVTPVCGSMGENVDHAVSDLQQRILGLISRFGDLANLAVLPAVAALFDRPYFTRGWIIQEVVIPANVSFQCGSTLVRKDAFIAAVTFYQIQFNLHRLNFLRKFQQHKAQGKPQPISENDEILMGHLEPLVPILRAQSHYHDVQKRQDLTMLSLQRRFSMTDVRFTEPIDRILGFLGLASDIEKLGFQQSVSEAYNSTWEDFHTLVVGRMCRNGDYSILEHVQAPKSSPKLPSWVPDFLKQQYPPLRSSTQAPRGGQSLPFSAGGPLATVTVKWQFDEAAKSLCLPVLIIDKLQNVGAKVGSVRGGIQEMLDYFSMSREITTFCEQSIRLQKESSWIYSTVKRATEAPWRTLSFDREPVGYSSSKQRATSRTAAGYAEYMEILPKLLAVNGGRVSVEEAVTLSEEQERQIAEMPQQVRTKVATEMRMSQLLLGEEAAGFQARLFHLEGKRTFISKKGFVGIGQQNLQVGDVVCVTRALEVPFLLRPLTVDGLDCTYQFIGEAYCDGIMDGEAWGLGLLETRAILI
ncbi:heterokaryon incompatibility [Fusarium acutatum]|uniref:Heterokaryon incompatibility n=1 Tax=Fusarium acutatum TaxID=78861 RepID=A0A8H4JAK6_9HYPO|nr:heterokaryon incompatibility [Fusarium acutatum]